MRRTGLALALLVMALAGGESALGARVVVDTPRELSAAVQRFERTGGVIVLRPGVYPRVVIGPRSARRLTLLAAGASARRLEIVRSRDVSVIGLTIRAPAGREAFATVVRSQRVVLDQVAVRGRALAPARLNLSESTDVRIQRSRFSSCKEYAPCIYLGRSSRVRIAGSTFEECYGCDFVRGAVGTGLVIHDNVFGNALVGECGPETGRECNHQDLIQIGGGENILVSRNHFGIYEIGAAQVYLKGPLRNVVVRNNVFRGTDPIRPGHVAPVGITVGNVNEPVHPPLGVVIAHNTILSGAPHGRGSFSSIALTPAYAARPPEDRPIVVNNVLAVVQTPEWLCDQAGAMINNIIREGTACSETDLLVDPLLDPLSGMPGHDSPTIDRGATGWAVVDLNGDRRDAFPDIGAYEHAGN